MEMRRMGYKGNIVIYKSDVLITGSDNPEDNGRHEGWIAVRQNEKGVEFPEPFGFGITPSWALQDLEAKM